MPYMNTSRIAEPTILDHLANAFGAVKAAYQRARSYDQTVRELSALSDRELNDLGLHRAMIAEIAQQSAYGK